VAWLRIRSPLGLAAGYDNSGRAVPLLSTLGFGHLGCSGCRPTGRSRWTTGCPTTEPTGKPAHRPSRGPDARCGGRRTADAAANRTVRELYRRINHGRHVFIGSGGCSPRWCTKVPAWSGSINRGLSLLLERASFAGVGAAVGADVGWARSPSWAISCAWPTSAQWRGVS
jgi:hypothetical protein